MKHTLLFSLALVFASAHAVASPGPREAALAFRRDVEVAPRPALLVDALRGLGEELSLPVGDVFDQGHTEWCWAFSAFHTLRTYYLNASGDANAVKEWKPAIEAMNEPDTFKAFLGQHVSTGQTGEPMRFVRMFREANDLPAASWTPFMPHGGRWAEGRSEKEAGTRPDIDMSAVKKLARREIVQKILDGLRQGSPSAYCADPHCVTIYGGVYENGEPTTYLIADSLGGRTYRADARRMNARLEYIATLE